MTQTKKKINSVSSNYVTTNTAQTITRQKTFSYQSEPIHIKDTRFDNSKNPSANTGNAIVTYDKNNKQVGYYQVLQRTNGYNSTGLFATHYKTDGTIVRSSIEVGINNTGATFTYAPTPASDSNTNEIATTAWVNNKISTTNSSLKRAKYSDSYFYRQYSDGWVIQGVYNTTNPTPPLSKQITITFPIIMSDTNYMVCIGQTGRPDSANVCRSTVVSKTTTTITVNIGTPSYFIIVGMGG